MKSHHVGSVGLLSALLVLGACSAQSIDEGDAGPQPISVIVASGVQEAAVMLDTVPPISFEGKAAVVLRDLVAASGLVADMDAAHFELVGSDGFRPSFKGCAPLAGPVLAQGYLTLAERRVLWDAALGFSGCYSVKGLARIEVVGPDRPDGPDVIGSDTDQPDAVSDIGVAPEIDPGSAGQVEVRFAGNAYVVDLGTLTPIWIGSQAALPLQIVVQASGAVTQPESYRYDFLAADGFQPTQRSEQPITFADLGHGGIAPDNHNLIWQPGFDIGSSWHVHHTEAILVLSAESSR